MRLPRSLENNQQLSATAAPLQPVWVLVLAMVGLVVAGVASRWWMVDAPNFKPVAALALFAGFYFRRTGWAMFAVVLMMLVSDLALGFYETSLTIAVYSSLLIACWLGARLRQHQIRPISFATAPFAGFFVASLLMSVTFFLLTNFAVWAMGQWYPTTWSGLVDCFVAAIPFFRSSLVSNLLFAQVILASYVGSVVLLDGKISSPRHKFAAVKNR